MTIHDEVRAVLDPILGVVQESIETTWEGHLVRMYIRGSAQMVSWGVTKGGLPIVFEGPPIQDAINYASTRGGQLITKLNEETINRITQTVSQAIKNKRGIDGMARDIRNTMEDMSHKRARMIARTESNDALSQAFLDRGKELGVESSTWIPRAPLDEDCLNNAKAGPVKLGEAFPSGHRRPPAHPNCECALAPKRLGG